MTRLALISIADGSVVAAPLAAGGWADLPGGARVSPATAGWEGGGAITYAVNAETGAETATEGPARFRLVAVTDFALPDGKRAAGAPRYAYDDAQGAVVETIPVEDIPLEPALTPAEKLANAGLTVGDLKELLGLV
jgi:hypothetical protein